MHGLPACWYLSKIISLWINFYHIIYPSSHKFPASNPDPGCGGSGGCRVLCLAPGLLLVEQIGQVQKCPGGITVRCSNCFIQLRLMWKSSSTLSTSWMTELLTLSLKNQDTLQRNLISASLFMISHDHELGQEHKSASLLCRVWKRSLSQMKAFTYLGILFPHRHTRQAKNTDFFKTNLWHQLVKLRILHAHMVVRNEVNPKVCSWF